MKKTKIVCTLGPATHTHESIKALLQEGMNVARFNFSHGSQEGHLEHIRLLKETSEQVGIPVAVLLDTKGPEMRLGKFKNSKVQLEKGQRFILTAQDIMGDEHIVSINHKNLPQEVRPGVAVLLSDGLIRLKVESSNDTEIHTIVENSGEISDHKRVAIPSMALSLPFLSDKDIEDIRLGIQEEVDFIAASFVQCAEDVLAIKALLQEKKSSAMIIAKIENAEGVKNMEEILAVADGFMVARGDLGVEIPAEEVPLIQKRMIRLCNRAGKPVITATQMLESMITNPRPTRAEASDVANAILDGTDAVMLSAETTVGKYPVEAVKTMTSIAKATEAALYDEFAWKGPTTLVRQKNNTTEAICYATSQMSFGLNAAGIITATESGFTARMVSKYKPQSPIFAVTPHDHVLRQLQLVWGVQVFKGLKHKNSDTMTKEAIQKCLESNCINPGDLVIVTAGVPIGVTGTTNMIQVHIA